MRFYEGDSALYDASRSDENLETQVRRWLAKEELNQMVIGRESVKKQSSGVPKWKPCVPF